MPLTRAQASHARQSRPSSAASDLHKLSEELTVSSADLPPHQTTIDPVDQHDQLYHKLTRILDLFQPNKLKAVALANAKAGSFPDHFDTLTRIKTELYMRFANAIALVALQDDSILRTMTDAVADPMLELEEIKDIIRDALDDNARNEGDTTAEAQAQNRRLEECVTEAIERVTPIMNENEGNGSAWNAGVEIFIMVLEDLCDRTPRRQMVTELHIELMDKANRELSTIPVDLLKDFVDDLETIVDRLDSRGAPLTDLAEDVRDTLQKAEDGRASSA
ncbi:MAG: hypothetical protein Q9162_000701 [Coniocarpon cinnabarinum]